MLQEKKKKKKKNKKTIMWDKAKTFVSGKKKQWENHRKHQ